MISKTGVLMAALVATVMPVAAAQADSVFVGAGDYTGSRSVSGGGLTANHSWVTQDLTLSWDITEDNGVFTYVYTLTGDEGALTKEISHTIFETSLNFTEDDILNGSDEVEGPGTFGSDQGNSNPSIPGDIFGIKFDFGSGTSVYTLVTLRVPVWGDVYLKGGRDAGQGQPQEADFVSAWNTGFGTDPNEQTQDFNNWIATPDTATVVTIPSPAAAGAGFMLLGSLLLGRRRRSTMN